MNLIQYVLAPSYRAQVMAFSTEDVNFLELQLAFVDLAILV